MHHFTDNFQQRQAIYKTKRGTCHACPLKAQCAPGAGERAVIRRWDVDIWEQVEAYLLTRRARRLLKRRQVVSETVFADAKVKHGMDQAQFRGRPKMQIQALLTATAMNLKRLLRQGPVPQAGIAALGVVANRAAASLPGQMELQRLLEKLARSLSALLPRLISPARIERVLSPRNGLRQQSPTAYFHMATRSWSWWRRGRFSTRRSWRFRKSLASVGRKMRSSSSILAGSPISPDQVLASYNLLWRVGQGFAPPSRSPPRLREGGLRCGWLIAPSGAL